MSALILKIHIHGRACHNPLNVKSLPCLVSASLLQWITGGWTPDTSPSCSGCCHPPAPSHSPDSSQRARTWLPSPPATSLKPQPFLQMVFLFLLFFFLNFNFNKAKLIVCEMKKWILQQSYPSDNSSQFAKEFPLASAMEQGLYFFF